MNWDSIKPWVSKLAPLIGTALGGPLGGAAGAILGRALGIKDAKPEDIQAAIQNGTLNGDQIIALRKAEDDFKLQLEQMQINSVKDLEDLAFQDRASARKREETVQDWTPRILAYGVTVGFFGLLSYLLTREVPAGSKDILNVMLGSLGTAWISIIAYYFGSSSGSAQKTNLLFRSTPTEMP